MNKSVELRKYLLQRFILTLAIVGLAEILLNFAMRFSIMPLLERLMGIDGMLSGKSLAEAIGVFNSCLLTVLARIMFGSGSLADSIAESDWALNVFGTESIKAFKSINEGLNATGLGLFATKVVLFVLLLVVLWMLPYAIGAVVYSRKVSDKVKKLEAAEAEREKEYDRQRNLLLSDITHDIKTPITTIAGFSRALADGTVPEEQKQEYLDAVYNKSMRVSNLVTMLFDYIKLDSTGYELHKEKMDFSECVRECVAGVYAEFEQKGLNVELNIPERSLTVNADKLQLERVINNLLTNTVKYNAEGTDIEIAVWSEATEVVLRVSDNGDRIDKEEAQHLFEPFARGDKTRKSGNGNGLGLSIAKKIVELHGGRIYLIQYGNSERYKMVKSFEIKLPIE